ncbi:MAG: hypothetical protein CMB99_10800 [Flavobacteriaceae bacterium]|nr:hypothetical protein [Flavobacteriaceae bacterium]|tara:strand:- start:168166 stop:169257 length:1092 start_codon:yes stop_codon:yes gene_type:complete
MINRGILLIGPLPEPTSGVSVANAKVLEILQNNSSSPVRFIDMSYPDFNDEIGSFSFKKLLFFISTYLELWKVFRVSMIYITPGQSFFGIVKYAPFILVARFVRKKIIIHIHGNHLHTEYQTLKGIKKKIFHFLITRADKGIVLSESLKVNLLPFLKQNQIQVVPNFADNNLVSEATYKNNDSLKILFLSNLMEEKGIFYFLESLKILQEKKIAFTAKIAGNIDVKIKKLVEDKMNEINCLDYLGVVRGEAKSKLLDWANIFVLPTFYKMEGQPISILEAMAARNVIITTKHAGIPDIFKDQIHGFYVEKRNSESIVEKIVTLDGDRSLISEFQENNLKYFKDNFSEQAFKKRIVECFENHKE